MLFKSETAFTLWSFGILYVALSSSHGWILCFRNRSRNEGTVQRPEPTKTCCLQAFFPVEEAFITASNVHIFHCFWVNINLLGFPFPEQSLVCFPFRNRHFLVGHISGCLCLSMDYKKAVTMQGKATSCLLQEAIQGIWIYLKVYFSKTFFTMKTFCL